MYQTAAEILIRAGVIKGGTEASLAGHEPTADKYFSVRHIFIST